MLKIIASYRKLFYAIKNTVDKITITFRINFEKIQHFEKKFTGDENFEKQFVGKGSQFCFTVTKAM